AIQANSPRSDFGKLSGRNSPLAPARTSERAREWVMSRTLAKAGDGCNFRLSRMLKKFASSVLASFRPSTGRRHFSEVGNAKGAFPFAKTHCKGERPTRSAVCISSGLYSLRPCPRNGASLGGESVLADSGRAGEVTARVRQVRRSPFEHPARVFSYCVTRPNQ